MKKIFSIVAIVLAGCSSASSPKDVVIEKNPCVTAGASYLEHWAEYPNGTCGPIPDIVINVSLDGSIHLGDASGTPRYDGCSVLLDGVTTVTNGIALKQTGKVTWASDGSSGDGIIMINASFSNGTSCTSTYKVTVTRT